MDLPELLEPDRIRCHCDIHSKKRALQTVAELLGAALREASDDGADGGGAATSAADGRGAAADGSAGGAAPGEQGKAASRSTNKSASKAANRATDGSAGTKADGRDGGERRGLKLRGRKESRAGARDEDGAPDVVSDMDILDALISRERLGSTGLGHGVALPHSRLDVVDAPLAAMITLNDGVDFESGDGEPVDLVLGLLVPRECNDEHLKILANLARRFNDAELREDLRGYDSGEELFARLQQLTASG